MNYREAVRACQGLVKRGAFDNGSRQLLHITHMDPYDELSSLSRRPKILRYYLRRADRDRVFKVPLPLYEYDQKVSKDNMVLAPITALTPGMYRHTIARHVKERDKLADVRLLQAANTPFRAFGASPFMRFLDPHTRWVARTSGRIWKAMQRGEARQEMEEFVQDLARFYADKESDKAGTKPTPEARQARIKELNRECRQRFIPATAPAKTQAVQDTDPATPTSTKATSTIAAPQAAANTATQATASSAEAADRIAKLKHYGLVAGGALAGGTGAGLLSYLLAPKMSGLGRALTMVGGAAAGGAAAHYGSELVNDWLASR